jgi:hypothetical protein
MFENNINNQIEVEKFLRNKFKEHYSENTIKPLVNGSKRNYLQLIVGQTVSRRKKNSIKDDKVKKDKWSDFSEYLTEEEKRQSMAFLLMEKRSPLSEETKSKIVLNLL